LRTSGLGTVDPGGLVGLVGICSTRTHFHQHPKVTKIRSPKSMRKQKVCHV
jgi:hypothetical protein